MRIKIKTIGRISRDYLINATKVYVSGENLCIEPIEPFCGYNFISIGCNSHETAEQCLNQLMIKGYVDLTTFESFKY